MFETLPEVGDLEKPKLVFVFDEAHLLFNDAPPALQQRIVEYSQAGMAVSDIARELGIGKGEVRLMLSLAKPGQS